MDPQLREVVDEINKGLNDRFASHSKDIDEKFSKYQKDIDDKFSRFQKEFRNDLKSHFENIEDLVKRAAEGYGATLERIERELKSYKTDCDTRFEDHNAVLENHKQNRRARAR